MILIVWFSRKKFRLFPRIAKQDFAWIWSWVSTLSGVWLFSTNSLKLACIFFRMNHWTSTFRMILKNGKSLKYFRLIQGKVLFVSFWFLVFAYSMFYLTNILACNNEMVFLQLSFFTSDLQSFTVDSRSDVLHWVQKMTYI